MKTILAQLMRAVEIESFILRERPHLLFQQLYNRLQWNQGEIRSLAEKARSKFLAAGRDFLHQYRRVESKNIPLMRILVGHEYWVRDLAWSPDGKRLISSSSDKTLRIWNVEIGIETAVLKGHLSAVVSCDWSPDGRRIASTGRDNLMKIWDADTNDELHSLSVEASCCAFSPDGKYVAAGCSDCSLKIWNSVTGREVASLAGHAGPVRSFAWSGDGRKLVSAGDEGMLRIWEFESGREIIRLRAGIPEVSSTDGHTQAINACVWSPDGRKIISSCLDGTIRLWDSEMGTTIAQTAKHRDYTADLSWAPDGTKIVSAGINDLSLKIWDSETGEDLSLLKGHTGVLTACQWSPDGRKIASASYDRSVIIWDFDPDAMTADHKVHADVISACSWSLNVSKIITSSYDKSVKIWDGETGEELQQLIGHEDRVHSCCWSPDGDRIASLGADSTSSTLISWCAASGREIARLITEADDIPVSYYAWSPDGKKIAVGDDLGGITIHNADGRGKNVSLIGHENDVSPGFSADEKIFAYEDEEGNLIICDVETGEIKEQKAHSRGVRSCFWDRDGGRLISSGKDGMVKIWDSRTGREITAIKAHDGSVTFCSLSPDGRKIVSVGEDGGLKIWDIETGKKVVQCRGAPNLISPCAWLADGRIVFVREGGTLILLDIESRREKTLLTGLSDVIGAFLPPKGGIRVFSSNGFRSIEVSECGDLSERLHFSVFGKWLPQSISPDGEKIAAGDVAGNLYLLKIVRGNRS